MLSCKIFKKERLLFNFGWSGAHSSLSNNAWKYIFAIMEKNSWGEMTGSREWALREHFPKHFRYFENIEI